MKQFLFSILILTFFFFLPLFKSTPISAAECGDWFLSSPSIEGNTVTFNVNPPAGAGSILAIRGLGGHNQNVSIPTGAESVSATLADDYYTAVMVYITCEISNTVTFSVPFDGNVGGQPVEGEQCTGFLNCVGNVATPGLNFKYQQSSFLTTLISDILPIAIGLGGFLAIIIIVISGIQFATSSGNPEAAGAARGRLIMALVGFAILILAFAITQVVDRVFLGGSGVL